MLDTKNIARCFYFSHVFRKARPVLAHLNSSSGAPPCWQEPEFQDEKLSTRPERGRLLTCSSRYLVVKEEDPGNQGAIGVLVLRRNCSLDVKQLP